MPEFMRRFQYLAALIVLFVFYQLIDITGWYKSHYQTLADWQNAPIIGYLTALVTMLKVALDHALKNSTEPPK